ncbi:MAG: TrkA C-terminal domain-containing protein [[Ruminococcus] torques]
MISVSTVSFRENGNGRCDFKLRQSEKELPKERKCRDDVPTCGRKVEAIGVHCENETNYTGITLKDLKVKPNNLIACIVRKRQIIILNGNDSIEAGDSVIVVTMEKHLKIFRIL